MLFRQITPADYKFINEVRNSTAPVYLHDSRLFTPEQTLDWIIKAKPDYWIINHDGTDIGFFRISNYNKENKNLYIGADLHEEYRGRGLGYAAYQKFLPYVFEQYELNKISLEVLSTNKKAYDLYKRLGFVVEGVKRQEVLKNNQYIDSIIMSILKKEYNGTILEN